MYRYVYIYFVQYMLCRRCKLNASHDLCIFCTIFPFLQPTVHKQLFNNEDNSIIPSQANWKKNLKIFFWYDDWDRTHNLQVTGRYTNQYTRTNLQYIYVFFCWVKICYYMTFYWQTTTISTHCAFCNKSQGFRV